MLTFIYVMIEKLLHSIPLHSLRQGFLFLIFSIKPDEEYKIPFSSFDISVNTLQHFIFSTSITNTGQVTELLFVVKNLFRIKKYGVFLCSLVIFFYNWKRQPCALNLCSLNITSFVMILLSSSNINEVIRSVLNFLFFFTIRFHKYKNNKKNTRH